MTADNAPIRLLLVDDHVLFLDGLRSFLQGEPGISIVGEAHNRTEALSGAQLHPDIILLDLDLANELSVDFLPDLLRVGEGARVLVVTGLTDHELHLQAIKLGAMGILLKVEAARSLMKAIHSIYAGEVWLSRSMMSTVVKECLKGPSSRKVDPEAVKIASLTEREREVVVALGKGLRNKQIASQLFISEKTVRHYLTSVFSKLEVSDRMELLIYSYQHGLVIPPAVQTHGHSQSA